MLTQENPDRAHAILTKNSEDGYIVSIRAPLNNKTGADELCRKFETGGGRKAAAGINHLPDKNYLRSNTVKYDCYFFNFILC